MLSIRTQDRMALVPYDKRVQIYQVYAINERNVTVLTDNYEVNVGGFPIGTYATKERALEVLDEIQEKLQYCNSEYTVTNEIYQMPKE